MDLLVSRRRDLDDETGFALFLDKHGKQVGRIRVMDVRRSSSIRMIDEEQAVERGEERTQLTEGRSYEYELEGVPEGATLEPTGVVQPSRVTRGIGRIEPGTATGLLLLRLIDTATATDVGAAAVEVRTSKIEYHSH